MKSLPTPPSWPSRWLRWFCDEYLLEEIEGDLLEAFHHNVQNRGHWYASWRYTLGVLLFFRPYAWERYSAAKQFLPMFQNYFKIAVRNLWYRGRFTAINLWGLSLGVSAVLLIGLYVQHQYGYDREVPAAERVYRLQNAYREQVYSCMSFPNYSSDTTTTQQTSLLQRLRTYEEVEVATHFVLSQSALMDGGKYYMEEGESDKRYVTEDILLTNEGGSFGALFAPDFLLGDPATAFSIHDQLVLTASEAGRWFGSDWDKRRLLGRVFEWEGRPYTLTGVVADPADNSHFNYRLIITRDQIPSWGAYTYLRLTPQAAIEPLLAQLNSEIDLVYPGYWEDELSKGVQAITLRDIHLDDTALYELRPTISATYLRTFLWIGVIILLIVAINYTNLSVAMYSDRQRELGIRRSLGARGRDISLQVLAEAVCLCLLAFPVVLILGYTALPYFNELMGVELQIRPLTWLALPVLLVLFGLLSGAYPAWRYGRNQVRQLLVREEVQVGGQRFGDLRHWLIGIQFLLLLQLLGLSGYIYQQLRYVQAFDLGYEAEGVLHFPIADSTKYAQLKLKLEQQPGILAVGANGVPGAEMFNQLTYKLEHTNTVFADGIHQYIGYDALQTLGVECKTCPDLFVGKDRVFLINETAARKLARVRGVVPEALVGEVLISEPEYENEEYGFGIPHVIDGIVPDYMYFSMKLAHQPLLLHVFQPPRWVYDMMVRVDARQLATTLPAIENAYRAVETERPFNYEFLSERLAGLYAQERRSGILLGILGGLTVILALAGLLGLVAYVAQQRRKEIGIRKVLGASIFGLLVHFNRTYLGILAIAALLAVPATWYMANRWLEAFTFRITPRIGLLLGVVVVFALLVLMVVSRQVYRVAATSPVDSLRTE